MHRGDAGLGLANVEAFLAETVLDGVGDLPALPAELVSLGAVDDLQALDVAEHERHRLALSIQLGTEVGAEVVYDLVGTCNEAADAGHALRERTYVEVHGVHAAELLGSSASVLAEEAEAVGIVDHEAEIVFCLECGDLVQDTHRAGHSVDALGDEEHSAAVLVGLLAGPGEDPFAVDDVVVAVFVLAAGVETDAVHEAGVALGVIDDDVVPVGDGVYGGDDALVAEVEEEGVLLLLEVGEHLLQLLVIPGMAGHHAGAHRICEAPLCGSLGVGLAHLGMVGQSKVVVEAPIEDFLAVEDHMGTQLALETGIHIIAECLVEILSERTA